VPNGDPDFDLSLTDGRGFHLDQDVTAPLNDIERDEDTLRPERGFVDDRSAVSKCPWVAARRSPCAS